jgi:hypothetical protein
MKNHLTTKHLSDCQKSLALKNGIIRGIQLTTLGVALIVVCLKIYSGTK